MLKNFSFQVTSFFVNTEQAFFATIVTIAIVL